MAIKQLASLGLAAGLGLGGLAYMTCVRYIPPFENGVKKVNISVPGMTGEKGWQNETLEGGKYRWVWPMLESLYTFPNDIQVMSFNHNEPERIDQKYREMRGPARIETPDTFFVMLDTDVFFKIENPYLTATNAGAGELYKGAALDKVEPALRRTFGQLIPEEFFEVDEEGKPIRLAAQEAAINDLNTEMSQFGIKVYDVRIRHPEYVAQVQDAFEKKSQEDQRVKTNAALAALEEKGAFFEELKKEGEAARDVRLQEGNSYKAEIAGKIEAYKQTRQSEGDKLVSVAEAEATRLKNEAYRGDGADLLVGLQMAKNMCNLERILIPVCGDNAINPLDLDGMANQWNR